MKSLAIDLGGTNIRIALINDGRIIERKTVPCQSTGTKEEVLLQIYSLIDALMKQDVVRIGIGVPSIVDFATGIVYNVQNIPSWDEVDLKNLLEQRYDVPVFVDNDVNCFVLGEKHFGVGHPFDNIVGITLGTGVGGGIVIRGKLYRGANTGAGEIGCLPYLDSDYEHYCSSLFLNKSGKTGKELSELAAQGDHEALEVWHQFGYHLGKLLQLVLYAYDPEAIIIGGGISPSSIYFADSMFTALKEDFPYQHEIRNIQIFFSTLEDCNMLGASQL